MTDLASRLRSVLRHLSGIGETRMFGGTCFTLNGNMLVVASGRGGLMVRTGAEAAAKALELPGVERMIMRGKPLKDYISVTDDCLDDDALAYWTELAAAFVGKLPPKRPVGGKPDGPGPG